MYKHAEHASVFNMGSLIEQERMAGDVVGADPIQRCEA